MKVLFIYLFISYAFNNMKTTAHFLYDGHSKGIIVYGVWRVRVRVQVFRREFSTYIYTYIYIYIYETIEA